MANKIKTLSQISKISAAAKRAGKKVGLITGCFDVIHAGHVDLFRFAKKHCDVVIVGLDSDETIKINKGPGRPFHNISQRERVLSELESVDYVFRIVGKNNWTKAEGRKACQDIYLAIKPNYLVTGQGADKYWRRKQEDAKAIGGRLLIDRRKRSSSSTRIIKFFAGEF